MSTNRFVCEICLENVNNYEPHVRFGADTVVKDEHGSYSSLMSNRVMVFAVYHTQCLNSVSEADSEDVVYIDEARELMESIDAGSREDANVDSRIVITRSGYLA